MAENALHPQVRNGNVITIESPLEEVYRFWRRLENHPLIMDEIKEVRDLGDGRYRWTAEAPGGERMEWISEIREEVENECISWQSVENPELSVTETVRFRPSATGQGTEVSLSAHFDYPPSETMGSLIARWSSEDTGLHVRKILLRCKQLLETGEIATILGQPSGRSRQGA